MAGYFCLILAAWRAYVEYSFYSTATGTPGVVVAVSDKGSRPTIQFTESNGELRSFTLTSTSSLYDYAVGQRVKVRYSKDKSQEAKLDINFYVWETTMLSLYFAAIFLVVGILTRTGKLVWGPLSQKRLFVDT
jgi:Protein of unknown function (DUF3592)